MIDHITPRINALKKCMGFSPVDYNVPQSAHTDVPASLFGGSAQSGAGTTLGSPLRLGLLSSLNPLTVLGGSDALITGRIYESTVVVMSVLCCLLLSFIISHARSPKQKLPPYPRRTPIIGNLSQIADKKWLFSRECKEQFGENQELVRVGRILTIRAPWIPLGEVMYLDVLGKPTVVFNSLKSAFELLERRARNSSGRPRFIVAGEIVNQGLALGLIDHGDLWVPRKRPLIPQILNSRTFSQLASDAPRFTRCPHEGGSAAILPYSGKGGEHLGHITPNQS